MRNHHLQIAFRISLLYALFASFWILVFDRLFEMVVLDQALLTQLGTSKWVSFVALTTLFIYTLLWRELRTQRNEETNRRLAEMNNLQRLTAVLLQQQTLDEVLPVVCSEAQQLTGAQGARLLLLENEAWLWGFHQTGNVMPILERIPFDNLLSGLAVRQKKLVLTNDPANSPQLFQPHRDLQSLLAIPLLINDEVIGTLHVVNKPGGFTEDDTRILGLFADQAAIAIVNARLHEHTKQLAVVKERQRLARELHDSTAQVLYSVILYADATRLALAADKKAEATENLQELGTLARQGIADMRLLLFRLHPPVLEDEGLVAALQARLEAIEARAGLQVDLRVEGENTLPIVIEEELYKIAQEALNNVVKHAKAEHVSVHFQFSHHHCDLTIQDDGMGFDPVTTTQGAGGLGLRSIAERVQQMGGHLLVESAPGQGTKVQVVMKTQQQEAMTQVPHRLRSGELNPKGFTTNSEKF